jgi:hypothetical protein
MNQSIMSDSSAPSYPQDLAVTAMPKGASGKLPTRPGGYITAPMRLQWEAGRGNCALLMLTLLRANRWRSATHRPREIYRAALALSYSGGA